ncbi:MAG: glycine cleavage system aminomethyltransferase GcvT [Kiritimatiellae bacterium]|nr:glycine cleavage system aminomethyltransferase GcvT [Kiritimatiellia bacterium]
MKTPLYNEHILLNARMAPFGGWNMPIQYEGILAEHRQTRTGCSLFDICHMGEFLLTGKNAEGDLERMLTQRISTLAVGQCRYGYLLNEEGCVLDDLTCYRLGEDRYYLVVNAATTGRDSAWIREHISPDTVFEDVSAATAKLDVQGPSSRAVLERVTGCMLPELKYFHAAYGELLGTECLVSRTGYTGEWGYELYFPATEAVRFWKALLADEGIRPAGLGARDTLRLEMAYPLYGHELFEDRSPLGVSRGMFVDFTKIFIGRDALLREKEAGSRKVLVGLRLETKSAARADDVVRLVDASVGYVTSGSLAPSLGVAVALAYVDAEVSAPMQELTIDARGRRLAAEVVELPFYREGTARKAR